MTIRKVRMKFGILAVLLAGAGCASDAPRETIGSRAATTPPPRGEALLRAAVLDGHNAARGAVGQPRLVWNPGLARAAAAYAAEMARTRRFAHARQADGDDAQGENLWMGTRGAYHFAEMVGHWVEEKKVFRRGPTPNNARTGRFGDVGHYTQIIWRGTTQVGCAIAANRSEEYLVCRYWPAGNVIGVDPLRS
jgi:hypothetical protein